MKSKNLFLSCFLVAGIGMDFSSASDKHFLDADKYEQRDCYYVYDINKDVLVNSFMNYIKKDDGVASEFTKVFFNLQIPVTVFHEILMENSTSFLEKHFLANIIINFMKDTNSAMIADEYKYYLGRITSEYGKCITRYAKEIVEYDLRCEFFNDDVLREFKKFFMIHLKEFCNYLSRSYKTVFLKAKIVNLVDEEKLILEKIVKDCFDKEMALSHRQFMNRIAGFKEEISKIIIPIFKKVVDNYYSAVSGNEGFKWDYHYYYPLGEHNYSEHILMMECEVAEINDVIANLESWLRPLE